MPFCSVSLRTELDDVIRRELELDFADLETWQEKEHKEDGTHAAITADSVTISGDLTVGGASAFEDIITNAVVANEIEVAELTVLSWIDAASYRGEFASETQANDGTPLVTLTQSGLSIIHDLAPDNPNVLSASASAITIGDAGATFQVEVNLQGTLNMNTDKFNVDTSGNTLIAGDLNVGDDFSVNTNKFTIDGATGDTVIAGTLGVTGLVTLTGSLSVGNDLNVVDDFSVATNKFTVDGGTGDTVVAGKLSVTNAGSDDTFFVAASRSGDVVSAYIKNTGGTAASTTSRFGIGQTDSESNAIQIIFNHNDGVATFFNRLTTTGTIKLKTTAGETIMANDGSLAVDGSTFNVDATNNRVGIGTASPAVQFHTTGTVRFANYLNDVLTVDGSGNLTLGGGGTAAVGFTDDIGNPKTMNFTSGLFVNVT